jgi:hypothetical protein
MPAGRPSLLPFVLALSVLGLAGCEPYMSMTDQVPARTRQAAALLPETPGYVGMVDVQTVLAQLDDPQGSGWADSLRRTETPRLRAFLDATGLDPKRDVQAVYGAIGDENALSGVLFANLTPAQLDRYLERAPAPSGRRTTYRDVPVYHLAFGDPDDADTLSVGVLRDGMLALSSDAALARAMVDRHRAASPAGLEANTAYMRLVKRVGHGSTAWLVGRDVVETALRDSAAGTEATGEEPPSSRVSQAGVQQALSEWADRVLGLSEVSSFEGRAGAQVDRLKRRLREQALSVTLTDTALRGQVYLTMRDNASASSVVDVAEGAVAMMKLSSDDLDQRHRDLLDEIEIEQDGAIVRVRFALDRERVRKKMESDAKSRTAHRERPAIRQPMIATRRWARITPGRAPLQVAREIDHATTSREALSPRVPGGAAPR